MAMQPYSAMDAAKRWLQAPKLDPETERAAALATIDFLTDVRTHLEKAVADIESGRARKDGMDLHEVWDFSAFDVKHIDFLLATLGEGQVRITLFGGEAKAGDTGIPGLWRVQTGPDGASNAFVLGRLPRAVLVVGDRGLDEIPDLVNPGPDVFAAPAILGELSHQLGVAREAGEFETLPEKPAFMVEMQRQPLSRGDMNSLLSTLGTGDIEVELQGFAHSRFNRTRVKNVWRSRIINNAGKTLLDAFIIARMPPEIPVTADEFRDGIEKCTDLIDWVKGDLERGSLGAPKNGAGHA